MFTLEQIHNAHSKVKTGADFPNYVREMKDLGVLCYYAFVQDGHCEYRGNNEYLISSEALYPDKVVVNELDKDAFILNLKRHQQGLTDYFTFCEDCARSGVSKWLMNLEENVCIYYDKQDVEVHREEISLS